MRFQPHAKGVVVTFASEEVEVLRSLASQLTEVLDGGVPVHGTDSVRDRLFPRAYVDPTEDRAERDFQSVVHEDLVRAKSDAAQMLIDGLDHGRSRRAGTEVVLTGVELEQWTGALNDMRLALGVAIGVTEDMDAPSDDANSAGFALYDWLTYLQGALVEAVMDGFE